MCDTTRENSNVHTLLMSVLLAPLSAGLDPLMDLKYILDIARRLPQSEGMYILLSRVVKERVRECAGAGCLFLLH